MHWDENYISPSDVTNLRRVCLVEQLAFSAALGGEFMTGFTDSLRLEFIFLKLE
jgi:hypothetical protein